MYTPVTEEGSKGEPQYAITDYVKAGCKKSVCMFLHFLLHETIKISSLPIVQNDIHLLRDLGVYHVKLIRLELQLLWYQNKSVVVKFCVLLLYIYIFVNVELFSYNLETHYHHFVVQEPCASSIVAFLNHFFWYFVYWLSGKYAPSKLSFVQNKRGTKRCI